MIGRRSFIWAAGGVTAAAVAPRALTRMAAGHSQSASGREQDLRLVPVPGRVFKTTADFNRDRVESWRCYVRVTSSTAEPVTIASVVVTQRAGNADRIVQRYDSAAAAALNMVPAGQPAGTRSPYVLAQLRLASTQPQSLALDNVRVEVAVRKDGGEVAPLALEFPLDTFVQRTQLVFPFRGPGIIIQGGARNDGHRNRSGMFAIDALGLTDRYAVMVKDGDTPDCLAGWGRPIIAPAAGVVVIARGDRPDQPVTGNADPKYFVPEFPDGGDPGNHVVIDHGNGEFSMIAHLTQGTVAVAAGQRVERGQQLGLLGNSGDSTATHVHHQLQTGADWTTADALPHGYENGPRQRHDRGWMFNARDA